MAKHKKGKGKFPPKFAGRGEKSEKGYDGKDSGNPFAKFAKRKKGRGRSRGAMRY